VSNFIGQRPDDPTVAPRLLELARELRAEGADFFHMASPRPIDLVLNFQQSMLLMYVPAWNAVLQSTMPDAEKKATMRDPAWRAAAREQWDAAPFPRDVAPMFRIIEVGTAENERWIGRSFGDLLAERPGHASDRLADWALENDLAAKFTYPYTNTDAAIVGSLLAAPENLISGSDAGAHIGMFDGAGDTTLVLARHVRERGDLTLEHAVRRMTAEPARFLGLSDRGTISVGAIADLAIFRLDELAWRDCVRVRDVPGNLGRLRRPPGGYRYTLIGGQVVQQDGEATAALPARFLDAGDRS
jgi:N-acyl-D-amino-acid deacylase